MSTPKVAVITGASQGIGAALVITYRKLGYAVVANSRSIFQGLHPYSVGPDGVAEYYDSQPIGMTADGWIISHYQVSQLG